ncbi:nitroreductase family protein [Gemella cuniculi]|uniref:nitroreductase family protein n=1 Tax=Gemella cuniculi TaxID=150240 RepID=UPI0003FDF5BC|nr:nitroreductase family protein [Gemella cuniculi]
MNEVIKTIMNHRANRSFVAGEKIPKEELDQIIACAKQAPSWMNGQHYSIIVVEGETKQKLADLIRDKSPGNAVHIENAATFLMFSMDFTNIKLSFDIEGSDFDVRDQYEPLLVGSMDTALAMQNACIVAESLGYGTVFCGAVRSFGVELNNMFNIPNTALFLCGLSIGRRDEKLSTEKVKPRLPKEANVGYNMHPVSTEEIVKVYRQTMVDFAEARETKTWTKKFADVYADTLPAEKVTRKLLERNGFISKKDDE